MSQVRISRSKLNAIGGDTQRLFNIQQKLTLDEIHDLLSQAVLADIIIPVYTKVGVDTWECDKTFAELQAAASAGLYIFPCIYVDDYYNIDTLAYNLDASNFKFYGRRADVLGQAQPTVYSFTHTSLDAITVTDATIEYALKKYYTDTGIHLSSSLASNTIDGTYDTVIGNGHTVYGTNNIVVGVGHSVNGSALLVLGSGNTVNGTNAAVVGFSNNVTSPTSIVGGYGHTITNNSGGNLVGGAYSTINGANNVVGGITYSTITGDNNVVTAYNSTITGGHNLVTGQYHIVNGDNNSVSGQYTNYQTTWYPDVSDPSTELITQGVFGYSNLVTGLYNSVGIEGYSSDSQGNIIGGMYNSVIGESNIVSGRNNLTTGNRNINVSNSSSYLTNSESTLAMMMTGGRATNSYNSVIFEQSGGSFDTLFNSQIYGIANEADHINHVNISGLYNNISYVDYGTFRGSYLEYDGYDSTTQLASNPIGLTILGTYNEFNAADVDKYMLVLANGTDNTHRKNILTVTKDGMLTIKVNDSDEKHTVLGSVSVVSSLPLVANAQKDTFYIVASQTGGQTSVDSLYIFDGSAFVKITTGDAIPMYYKENNTLKCTMTYSEVLYSIQHQNELFRPQLKMSTLSIYDFYFVDTYDDYIWIIFKGSISGDSPSQETIFYIIKHYSDDTISQVSYYETSYQKKINQLSNNSGIILANQGITDAIAVRIKSDNGIDVDNQGIYAKLKSNGGIVVDSNGLSVDTTIIQPKLAAGTGITINGSNVISTDIKINVFGIFNINDFTSHTYSTETAFKQAYGGTITLKDLYDVAADNANYKLIIQDSDIDPYTALGWIMNYSTIDIEIDESDHTYDASENEFWYADFKIYFNVNGITYYYYVRGYYENGSYQPGSTITVQLYKVITDTTYSAGEGIDIDANNAISLKITDEAAGGSVVSFNNAGENLPLKSCIVDIEPVQSGSGDPSPSNVRPITGWTECNITVADDETTPTVSNVYNIEFPSQAGTVYGGTLDVTNGVLIVDRAMVVLEDLSWNYTTNRASTILPNCVIPTSSQKPDAIAEKYIGVKSLSTLVANDFAIVSSSGNAQLLFYYDGTPITGKLVYKMATPTTYNLTPTEVKTLLGINNIFADCGDIKTPVTYYTEAGEDILYLAIHGIPAAEGGEF